MPDPDQDTFSSSVPVPAPSPVSASTFNPDRLPSPTPPPPLPPSATLPPLSLSLLPLTTPETRGVFPSLQVALSCCFTTFSSSSGGPASGPNSPRIAARYSARSMSTPGVAAAVRAVKEARGPSPRHRRWDRGGGVYGQSPMDGLKSMSAVTKLTRLDTKSDTGGGDRARRSGEGRSTSKWEGEARICNRS